MKKEFCDNNNYILRHRIVNGELIIYYADGSTSRERYSISREKEVLAEEKRQIQAIVSDENLYKAELKKRRVRTAVFGGASILYIALLCTAVNVPTLIATAIFLYITGKNVVKGAGVHKKFKDIQKYKMFLKNESIMNDAIECKRVKPSKRRQAGIRKINANTIDKYSYRDVTDFLKLAKCKRSEYGDTGSFVNKISAPLEQHRENFKDLKEKAKVKVKTRRSTR